MHSIFALDLGGVPRPYRIEHIVIGACTCMCNECVDSVTGSCVCTLCACRNDDTKQQYAFAGVA